MTENLPTPLPSETREQEPTQRRLQLLERLVECYQKALGHELPNELVAIQGLLRILQLEEEEHLGPEGRDCLTRLHTAAQRTHQLIRLLAELARTARQDQAVERISLAEAAVEAAAEVKMLVPGLSIEYHFPQVAPVVMATRSALRHVLVRLLRHVARARSGERPTPVPIGARQTRNTAELWITDRDRDLTREEAERLFEPFVPQDPPDADAALSLFLVRHTVESWGGTIHVHSEPGQGSTFTIPFDQP